ncbi:MAG: hypothetical protein Q9162_006855 [Coniocarpon cinnabarinum]
MLVEVNNTLGERRLYWCPSTLQKPDNIIGAGLRHTWQKDFHVSPFNSRKGGYAMRALDPFEVDRDDYHMIDNRITLLSNHGKAKLVARVLSADKPLDPSMLSTWGSLKVLARWGWVGFATFPRIVFEAAQLYFVHKLHVWFRPEVRASSISQTPTRDERRLESFFRLYLADVAKTLPAGVELKYAAPFTPTKGPMATKWATMHSSHERQIEDTIFIRVTAPAFYSRMIYYDEMIQALYSEGVRCRDENRTVHLGNSGMLESVLCKHKMTMKVPLRTPVKALSVFRPNPPPASYPESSEKFLTSERAEADCNLHSAGLDTCVLAWCSRKERLIYTFILLKSGMNPVTARPATARLARQTKGRVVTVDYRLSPQVQFPVALLDLLLTYLALLYPPPGSLHTSVPSSSIVLTGESSGGALCLSLIQFILHLRRQQQTPYPRVPFHGRDVVVPMPAGVALLSTEADRTISLPSRDAYEHIDFLQEIPRANTPEQIPDHIWPSNPPRHDVYCHGSGYLHPMVNPAIAEDWRGCCPLWLSYGQERCLDGGKMVASTAASQGVPVQFFEYEGMPHIFPLMFSRFKQSEMCMREWADVCCKMAGASEFQSKAIVVASSKVPGDSVSELRLSDLFQLSREEAMAIIRAEADRRPLITRKDEIGRAAL